MKSSIADRAEVALAATSDLGQVADAVFRVVGREVPFDFACLATLDPATGLITGAIKSRPLAMGDEEFSAAEYGGDDVNRFDVLARRPVPAGGLVLDTDGDVSASRRFREFMAPRFGFTDELRVACRARSAAWAAVALYRAGGEPAFTAEEVRSVAGIHVAVADAVQRILLAPASGGDPGLPVPAVLLVDAVDHVTDRSAAAEAAIAELGGWDGDSLPSNLLAVVASARAGDGASSSRVRGRSGAWAAIRALALTGGSVVVTVEPAAQAAVAQIALAARGLTGRETEIVQQVLHGRSTKSMAALLHLSPHTVQDHLKAVFEKVGVSSRRELIAQFVE